MSKHLSLHICSIAFFTLLLSLLTTSDSTAQSQYNIEHITTENGLPSDGIKGLQFDEHTGFLWVATELGLVRYNGSSCVIFNKENLPYLRSEKVFPLSKDINGNIFAVNAGAIFQVDTNKLIPIKSHHESENAPGMLQIYVSAKLPQSANTHINDYFDKFLPLDSSHCIIHRNDTLWTYTSGNARREYLTALRQGYQSFTIGENIFYYNGKDTFFIYDVTSHKFKKAAMSSDVDATKGSLPEGKKGIYWEAGMSGPVLLAGSNAWLLKFQNGVLAPILICSEVPTNSSINYIQYWEKGDILFLGTGSKGILVIRKNYLRIVRKNNPGFDNPNAIYSQILLSNGNILANTGDILGPAKEPTKEIPIKGSFHNSIFITKDSVLYYSVNDSLYNYNYKTKTTSFTSKISNSLYLAFASSGNNTYVANKENLFKITNNRLEPIAAFKTIGDPFQMMELQPGIFAIATIRGLFRFNIKTSELDTILKNDSPVRALWKYKSYLFIGTYGGGIYIMKDGVIKKLPLDNNNYLKYTHCFILDAKEYCWMSTNRGLLKASLNDMLGAYDHDMPYVYYHFFGKNEGMDITEMNGGCTPCGIKLQNSIISFPTMDGALWVDPYMPVRFPNGNVYIDQVTINGNKAEIINNNYLFDENTHDISFFLGFSAWCDKENIYLQYAVNNPNSVWQKVDAQRPVVRLSNLPYGKYDLYIRELQGFGAESYSIRKISFEIQLPWYLRWWGETCLILIFVIFITLISILANRRSLIQQRMLRSKLDDTTRKILVQNERLEKNDRVKTRLISIISHDIITPLKYLHLTTKYLVERKASLPENLRNETLEEVVNTSRELELLSTNILNWIKYQNEERRIVKEKIHLHDLVEQIFVILKSLTSKHDIQLVNDIAPEVELFQFVEPIRIILYNLTVNAINFTKHGSITISSAYVSDNIRIEVKDTGLGMPQSKIKNITSDHIIISSANVNKRSGHGLGYLIIKDLLKMIAGEFYIESKVNHGTSVFITFPYQG